VAGYPGCSAWRAEKWALNMAFRVGWGWAYLRALGTPAAPGQPHVLVTWRRRGAAIPAVAGEAVAEAILAGLALALLLLVAAILVD